MWNYVTIPFPRHTNIGIYLCNKWVFQNQTSDAKEIQMHCIGKNIFATPFECHIVPVLLGTYYYHCLEV